MSNATILKGLFGKDGSTFKDYIKVDYYSRYAHGEIITFQALPNNKSKKELAELFFELLEKLGTKFELVNCMYNFLIGTPLIEYIVSIKIDSIRIDFKKQLLSLIDANSILSIWTTTPALILNFSKIKNTYECNQVTLYKYKINKDKYVSKEFVISNGVMSDNSYLVNKNHSDYVFIETADYDCYNTDKSIDSSVQYSIEALFKGKKLSDICGYKPYSIEKYTAFCKTDQDGEYLYKGTYTINEKASLNVNRLHQEKSFKQPNIDFYGAYSRYDIRNLLWKAKSIVNTEDFDWGCPGKLISETIEYTEDFYKKFHSNLHELPGSKNYYYFNTQEDNCILEVSCSEIAGSGKRLKKINNYYKLLQKDKESGLSCIYAIKPDLNDITKVIYELVCSKDVSLGHDPFKNGYTVEYLDPEIDGIRFHKIETKIKEACNTVGVQYR